MGNWSVTGQVGHRWERGQYVHRNMREDGVCTEAGRSIHVEGTRDILSGLHLLSQWSRKQGHQLRRRIRGFGEREDVQVVL